MVADLNTPTTAVTPRRREALIELEEAERQILNPVRVRFEGQWQDHKQGDVVTVAAEVALNMLNHGVPINILDLDQLPRELVSVKKGR